MIGISRRSSFRQSFCCLASSKLIAESGVPTLSMDEIARVVFTIDEEDIKGACTCEHNETDFEAGRLRDKTRSSSEPIAGQPSRCDSW